MITEVIVYASLARMGYNFSSFGGALDEELSVRFPHAEVDVIAKPGNDCIKSNAEDVSEIAREIEDAKELIETAIAVVRERVKEWYRRGN